MGPSWEDGALEEVLQSHCLFSWIKSSSFQEENLAFVKGGGSPSLRLNRILIYGGGAEWVSARTLDLERPIEAGCVLQEPSSPPQPSAPGALSEPSGCNHYIICVHEASNAQTWVNRAQIVKHALARVSCSLHRCISNIGINTYGCKRPCYRSAKALPW